MVVSAKTPNSKLNNDVIDKRFRTPTRSPALRPGNENAPARRIRSTEVTSRFLSSSSTTSNSTTSSSSVSSGASRRSASPVVGRTVTPAKSSSVSVQNSVRRAQSTERRWLVTPRGANAEMSNAAKQLIASTRSLSVSFQGRSFSTPTCAKQPSLDSLGSGVTKETPERRQATPSRDQKQNSNCKASDQRLWPGRLRSVNIKSFTQSVDFGATAAIGKPSVIESPRGAKGLPSKLHSVVKDFVTENEFEMPADANSAVSIASDSDSVSCGRSASLKEHRGLKGAPRGIVVQSRYLQDTSKFWKGSKPSSPALTDDGSSTPGSSIYSNAKKMNETMASSPRVISAKKGLSSSPRPASPSKLLTTSNSSRRMPNQITMKNVVSNNIGITQLSSAGVADMRTGKIGENRTADGHELRLLYNRHLQWRFVNAKAVATMQYQTKKAEKELYNAWVAMLQLWNVVQSEKIKLQVQRQMIKLCSALKGQVPFLLNWESIEEDHCNSLSEAIKALEASVVSVPVTNGATVDIQELEYAVYSAISVMQKMGSSICSLLPKVEQADELFSEMASIATNEKALLNECKDLSSKLLTMEAMDLSLRAHMLQLSNYLTTLTMEEAN